MIVYGERDRGAPVSTLHDMPNSEVFEMKHAGHACYMNDTPEWHRLFYNFLRALESDWYIVLTRNWFEVVMLFAVAVLINSGMI